MSEDYSNTPRKASIGNGTSTETIGIDDGPFTLAHRGSPNNQGNFAPLVAIQLRDSHLVNARIGRVQVDGLDATDEALRLLRKLPKLPVLLSGVTFGGFNLIDPRTLQVERQVPVIVVTGTRPSNRRIKRALVRHFPDWHERWNIIGRLGPLRRVRTVPDEPPLYFESFGCSAGTARALLSRICFVSRVPEPLRVASIVARGLSLKSSIMETGR